MERDDILGNETSQLTEMEAISLISEMEEQVNPEIEENNETIEPRTGEKCIRNLIHASKCKDVYCGNSNCHRMKRMLQHIEICSFKSKINKEGCLVCKQLIIVLEFYAMHYNQVEEFVLPASSSNDIISIKIEELQLPKQLMKAQILIRENIRYIWTNVNTPQNSWNENSQIKNLLIVRTVVNYCKPKKSQKRENSNVALTLVHRPLPWRLQNTAASVRFRIPAGMTYREARRTPELGNSNVAPTPAQRLLSLKLWYNMHYATHK